MKVPIVQAQQVTPSAKERALSALAELRRTDVTPEEMEILEQFEDFRRGHPIRFSSLVEEE